jgi:hypothetical protein
LQQKVTEIDFFINESAGLFGALIMTGKRLFLDLIKDCREVAEVDVFPNKRELFANRL